MYKEWIFTDCNYARIYWLEKASIPLSSCWN